MTHARNRNEPHWIWTALILLSACGGAPPQPQAPAEEAPKVRLTAADYFRTELVSAEFTDEVDPQRYRAIGEVLEEFSPRAPIIYLVGKLRQVPTQARIEVRWVHENLPEPQARSDVYGSGTFSFIAEFRPPQRRFYPGNYEAQIYVNGTLVGSAPFRVRGTDPFAQGPRVVALRVAPKIDKRTGRPVAPRSRFKRATRLFAAFATKNVLEPFDVAVRWYRGDDLFSESVLHVNGNGRFHSEVASPAGLPRGNYVVRVERDDAVMGEVAFTIGGGAAQGPSIDALALDAQPITRIRARKKYTFRKGVSAIYCAVRFLDLEPHSEIRIEWVNVDGDEGTVYHEALTPVPDGGSGTLTAVWDAGEVYPGSYKAVVYINDTFATEAPFTVK